MLCAASFSGLLLMTSIRKNGPPTEPYATKGLDPEIRWRRPMDGLIYLIGLIVVIMAILSFFGLH